VGLRTTAGLVPRLPITLPWHDQSVTGPMARDVADCALFLDAMTGFSAVSPLSVPPAWQSAYEIVERAEDLSGVRLAYAPTIGPTGIDPEVARLCRDAAFALERHGAAVEEVAFDLSDGRDAFITLRGEAMVGNHLARLERLGELNPNLAGNIRLGLGVQILDIARAEHRRAEIWHRWRALFERYDLLLTPTTPVLPFPVESDYPTEIAGKPLESYMDWLAQTFLVSLAGLPAASVPAGLAPLAPLSKGVASAASGGIPVGLQIVGPRLSEPRILACAKFVERDHPIGWAVHAA
ncbi:MAG: amidase, partial [Longimicrobiales bacterium]